METSDKFNNYQKKMVKAVILDFGGVLFKNKPKEEWLGFKNKLDIDRDLWNQASLGQADDEEVFKKAGDRYQVSADEIKKWLFSRREPNYQLLKLLKKLKPGIKKAVINNGLKTLFRGFLAKYDLSLEFDANVNSAEEGVKKPNPKIYLDICIKLDIKPEECLFIDDDEKNLKGAKDLRMKIILFESVPKLADEFKMFGLL